MEVKTFADIEAEFIERVNKMVYCSAATIDSQGRPRSRILHPIWEGAIGWIGTTLQSHKSKHLTKNPYMSLAYITEIHRPVYVDCKVEWMDDLALKQRIWDLFKNTPAPLGYDPGTTFKGVDVDFGVLKLTPWRIDLVSFPSPSFDEGTRVWRNEG